MSIYELLVSGDLHRNVPEMSQLDTFDSDLQTSCEAAQWAGLDADARPGWKRLLDESNDSRLWCQCNWFLCAEGQMGSLGKQEDIYGIIWTYDDICQSAQTEHLVFRSFSCHFNLVSWLRVLQKHHRACDILSLGDALSGNGLWPKTRWNLLRLPFQHRQGEHQSIQKNWRLARRWQRHGRLFRSVSMSDLMLAKCRTVSMDFLPGYTWHCLPWANMHLLFSALFHKYHHNSLTSYL